MLFSRFVANYGYFNKFEPTFIPTLSPIAYPKYTNLFKNKNCGNVFEIRDKWTVCIKYINDLKIFSHFFQKKKLCRIMKDLFSELKEVS